MSRFSAEAVALPVAVVPLSNRASTAASSGSSSSSWTAAPGGLGGLASRYTAGTSAASLRMQQDAAWEAAGASGTDRVFDSDDALLPIDQPFDPSSAEQASMDIHIASSNRGYQLLRKMGWAGEGNGLGRRGGGRAEPVRIADQTGVLGLGKATEYAEYASSATETRKAMTSELIAAEDDEGRAAREAQEARRQGIADAVKRETSVFYCEVCNKQYAKVTEFENHLSSYDHHHK